MIIAARLVLNILQYYALILIASVGKQNQQHIRTTIYIQWFYLFTFVLRDILGIIEGYTTIKEYNEDIPDMENIQKTTIYLSAAYGIIIQPFFL